jgi:hypothetical protein
MWLTIAVVVPMAGYGEEQAYPDELLFGDTHVHTANSGDAFGLGTRLGPDDAYRFAKGDRVRGTGGSSAQLTEPLDFLLVADHAENLGLMPRLVAGDPTVPDTPARNRWQAFFADLIDLEDILSAGSIEEFDAGGKALNQAKGAWQDDYELDETFRRSVWAEVVAAAERHNDPGSFTTFVGFEWSARFPNMIHRNVLFADGPDVTSRALPFSRFDSDDVEDLWAYLDAYETQFGGRAIAIPHNSNLSGGLMFSPVDQSGGPLSRTYAQTRARWEPILEVTQIKGDSEVHPDLAPDDAFAGHEFWPGGAAPSVASAGKGGKEASGKTSAKDKTATGKEPAKKAPAKKTAPKEPVKPGQAGTEDLAWARQSYARHALGLGLQHRATLGVNPFKFGMIGSTDSHTALATADESAFWGKMGSNEPSPYRAIRQSIFSATGYAAVWADENTREGIFAALKRKETYATTGPRIGVRFFGGWNFATADADRADIAAIGYRKGVPMGGDLASRPKDAAPTFLFRAVKDANGANLERAQIVKGWRETDGELVERVYDVALSDGRAAGNELAAPLPSTVDVASASYSNDLGDKELVGVWRDPHFDPSLPAFYYFRTLQIETPRWTAYDANTFGIRDLNESIPMVVRDRAYTSPIWYAPDAGAEL